MEVDFAKLVTEKVMRFGGGAKLGHVNIVVVVESVRLAVVQDGNYMNTDF
jgi:hypothetical protein